MSERRQSCPVVRPPDDTAQARNRCLNEAFGAGCEAALLLERDARVTDGDLGALADIGRTQPQAIIGARTVDAALAERVYLPGWRWCDQRLTWEPVWMLELNAARASPTLTACRWLSPGAVHIPQAAWAATGGFEPGLPGPLGLLDWCLRARRAGFPSFEARVSCGVSHSDPVWDRPGQLRQYLETLVPTMLLARRHGQPAPPRALAGLLLRRALAEEFGCLNFWADYDTEPGRLKRSLWFAAQSLGVLRRPRFAATVQAVFGRPAPGGQA